MPSYGMLRRVAIVRRDVSEERSASIIRVIRISELGTILAVTSNRLAMKYCVPGPPLWSRGQSSLLQTQRSRVRFPALPDFLTSSSSATGSIQPREHK
jgi:hypothetical protein